MIFHNRRTIMSKNDFRRLKEEADIAAVVTSLGIQVTKRGSNNFILCPMPDHDDKNPRNCYFRNGWNNVYCSACGRGVQAIDLIMYTTGCNYGEAADMLWDLSGRPSWYKGERNAKKLFALSRGDARLIGIHFPGRLLTPKRESEFKEVGKEYKSGTVDSYLECDVHLLTWRDFMSEKDYKTMVRAKAKEAMGKLKDTKDYLTCVNPEVYSQDKMIKYLIEGADVGIKKCTELILKAAG